MKQYPRVLVISHNPFSDSQNNGKTLSAFFDGWPKSNLAQLYLTLDTFDTTVCEKFYRISDLDVLKYFFKRQDTSKEFYQSKEINDDKKNAHKSKFYIIIRNLFIKRLPVMYCMRNLIWSNVKPWKFKKLNRWLDEFKPELIFFQSSNVYKIIDLVEYIKNKYNIPLIMQTTDDYVTSKFSLDPFYWIDHAKIVKRYKKAVKNSECVFAIGDMMMEEYQKKFGGNFKVAMNSQNLENKIISYETVKNKTIILTYAGNLGLNRWKILSKIGKILDKIKKETGTEAKLNIYSIEPPEKNILKKLYIENTMEYLGSLNQNELIEVRNNSDILVHVESFDRKNKYITRLSISTKIPEYLLSERCILAIGPKDVASIEYIKKNQIGEVISTLNESQMEKQILKIVKERERRNKYIQKGKEVANMRHSFSKNKELVQNEIIKAR